MRYIRMIGTFLRTSFLNDAAYRANFYTSLLSTALGLAGSVGGVWILFSAGEEINGWTLPETLAVLGVYLLVQALKDIVFGPSLNALGGMDGEIETGNFDYTLLKPVSKQFYVSVRRWSLWTLLDVAVGAGVLAASARISGWETGGGHVAWFLLSLAVGVVMLYSLMLAVCSVAFWYRGTYLLWILGDILQAGRYPVGIYPKGVRLLLTWIFPVGFIVTVPAQTLLRGPDPWLLAGLLLAALLFAASSLFFHISLKRYSGASS